MPRNTLIQIRRGTAAEWNETNPILSLGEPGLETDTKKVKYGDGFTPWFDLPYAGGTLNISDVIGLQDALDGKSDDGHNHSIQNVEGLQDALDSKQPSGNYATLVDGLVPSSQLPSYVDDVLEYPNLASFPAVGESSKIYVARDNGKTYRWGGSTYVEISASPGSTDSVPEGSVNLYHTTARAAAAAPVQSVNGQVGSVVLNAASVGAAPSAGSTNIVTVGAVTATSVNKVTITQPSTGATLTLANGKTLTANNTVSFSGQDGASVSLGAGGAVVYETSIIDGGFY